jgi:hypothetical protein
MVLVVLIMVLVLVVLLLRVRMGGDKIGRVEGWGRLILPLALNAMTLCRANG